MLHLEVSGLLIMFLILQYCFISSAVFDWREETYSSHTFTAIHDDKNLISCKLWGMTSKKWVILRRLMMRPAADCAVRQLQKNSSILIRQYTFITQNLAPILPPTPLCYGELKLVIIKHATWVFSKSCALCWLCTYCMGGLEFSYVINGRFLWKIWGLKTFMFIFKFYSFVF